MTEPRLSYKLFRLVSALNYHLPRRLTKGGLLVLAGMVMAGAVGADIDQSVAFESFALLFSLLLVALLWAPWLRGRFSIERSVPRVASVGQPFRYRVQVQNRSNRSYRHIEVFEDFAQPHPSYEDFKRFMRPMVKPFRLAPRPTPIIDLRPATTRSGLIHHLGPQAAAETEVEIMPLRRGPLRLCGATVARQDPLGLARGFVKVAHPETILVLPKRYRMPPLNFAGNPQYQLGGVALASSIGESEEFISLRDYRPGDPFRRIHWRSWARAGRPIVKEHQDEFFVRHALVLDTCAAKVTWQTFEEAVSVAASLACGVDTQECLLDLLFVGSEAFCVTAGRGLGQAEQLLAILASVQPHSENHFEPLRDLVLRHQPLLSSCLCVLVAWDEPRRDLVRQLRTRGLPVLALVISAEPVIQPVEAAADDALKVHFLRPGHIAEDLQALESITI
jgi:uncharacterized protein (DUF58 family)